MNRLTILILFVFLDVINLNNLLGQEKIYNFLHFAEKDGLSSNRVNGLAEDRNGLIWIANNRGLSYFDGYRFTHINVNANEKVYSSDFNHLAFDADNKLWISTYNQGLLCYDPARPNSDAFSNYFPKLNHSTIRKSELYTVLPSKSGNIYFGGQETDLQVLNVKSGIVEHISFSRISKNPVTIFSLAEDSLGHIWVGTRYNGLIRYRPKTKEAKGFDLKRNLPGENAVSAIAVSDNKIYLSYYDYDLVTVSGEEFSAKRLLGLGKNVDPYDNNILRIAHLKENNVWLAGHSNQGIYVYHEPDKIEHIPWVKISNDKSKQPRINSILPVKDGYWVATASEGIFFYGKRLNQFNKFYPNLLSEPILEIIDSEGQLFFRTSSQFGVISNDLKEIHAKFSLKDLKVSKMFILGKSTYFSTYDQGVFIFDHSEKVLKPLPINGSVSGFRKADCNSIIEDDIDGQSYLWIGSWNSGLYKYNVNTKEIQLFSKSEGLPDHKVITVAKDNLGNIWLGMDGFGLVKLINRRSPSFRHFFYDNQGNSVASNTIFSFLNDRDNILWYSNSSPGIGCYTDKGSFSQIPDGNQYPWLYAHSLKLDSFDRIWMKARDGYMIFNSEKKTFLQLLKGKGVYPTSNFATYDVLLKDDDVVWCTDKGLIKGSLEHTNVDILSARAPIISSFRIHNAENSYRLSAGEIILDPHENNFSLTFSSSDQHINNGIQYAYKLEGLDQDWVIDNTEQVASYRNLPGGKYVIKIKKGDLYGNWSPHIAELPIYLKTVWYQTWWFRCLVASLFLLAIILFFVYRINQQKKINELQRSFNSKLQHELDRKIEQVREQDVFIEREKQKKLEADFKQKLYESELKAIRSQMNPHFVFNVLNSIEAYVVENDSKNASSLIHKFAALSRIVLENSQFSFVTIESEIKLIRLYLELERVRFSEQFDFEIDLQNLDYKFKMIPSMLIQPLAENAVHHGVRHLIGKKGKIKLSFFEEDGLITIKIMDNGVGMRCNDQTKDAYAGIKKTSFGLKGINERIDIINRNLNKSMASLHMENLDQNDQFTTIVTIILPLQYASR